MSKLTRIAEERAGWLAADLVHEQKYTDGTAMLGHELLAKLAIELQDLFKGRGIPQDIGTLIESARQRANWLISRIGRRFYDQDTNHVEEFPLAGDWFYGPTILWTLVEAIKKNQPAVKEIQ